MTPDQLFTVFRTLCLMTTIGLVCLAVAIILIQLRED